MVKDDKRCYRFEFQSRLQLTIFRYCSGVVRLYSKFRDTASIQTTFLKNISNSLPIIFVFFYVLFVLCRSVNCVCVCVCVCEYYCYRVATQLVNKYITSHHISYHILSYIIYHIISYIIHNIISYPIIYHIISYIIHNIISYPIIYHILSYIISYPISYIISYHILSYHILYHT